MSASAETLSREQDIVRQQFETLMALPDESFGESANAFIHDRLSQLEARTPNLQSMSGLGGNRKGFLLSTTEILPFATGTGFVMDDPSIYDIAMRRAKEFYGAYANRFANDPAAHYRNAMLGATQYTQTEYFGGIHVSDENLARREELVQRGSFVDDEPDAQPASIADFKGIAVCAERTAVANNLLQLFGFEPVYAMGELKIGDERSALHAFLVLRNGEGKEVIYDPTNPTKVFGQDGGLKAMHPAIYPIEDEFLNETGSEAQVQHKKITRTSEGEEVTTESYTFKNNPFASDVHPT